MSKPALQQETGPHVFRKRCLIWLPSFQPGLEKAWSQKASHSQAPVPHPHPPSRLPFSLTPSPTLGFLTVGAHLLLRLQACGPHLCSPNPGLSMCIGGRGMAAPQRRRERKEWGLGTLPGLYSRHYMKSMQMLCKNSMQISTSFTYLSPGSAPPGSHDP